MNNPKVGSILRSYIAPRLYMSDHKEEYGFYGYLLQYASENTIKDFVTKEVINLNLHQKTSMYEKFYAIAQSLKDQNLLDSDKKILHYFQHGAEQTRYQLAQLFLNSSMFHQALSIFNCHPACEIIDDKVFNNERTETQKT